MLVMICILTGFSMSALLTLSVERFLGLKCPFFHQTAVTKRKLVIFCAFPVVITVSLFSLHFTGNLIGYAAVIVCILLFLLLFVCLNYNMLMTAKSKRKSQSISTTRDHEQAKRRIVNLKQISTCSVAVGCFFICSFLALLSSVLQLTGDTRSNGRPSQLFRIWSCTVFAMNSTCNCLIFFWRISILRREGMKTVKCFRSARC